MNVDNCVAPAACNAISGLCEEAPAEPLPIVEGDEWRFFRGTVEPSAGNLTAWTGPGFDDTSWEPGNSGFGYGTDCSHDTILANMQNAHSSLYLRRLFQVDNPALVEELTLTIDYDDSFVAYVNGVEVARNNILGSPPAFDALAQSDHECSGSAGAANPPESFDIHIGFDPGTLLQSGVNILAIQGHNLTLDSSDFTLIPTLAAVEVEPCINPANCTDGDLCTVDDCLDGVCLNTPVSCLPGETCNSSSGQCELVVTVSFQDGVDGYAGTLDTFIQEEPSAVNNDNGALEALNWDSDDPLGSGFSTMTLIRFENVFGDDTGRVPIGAQINLATLSYTVGGDADAPGDSGELHEVLVPWTEAASWTGFGASPGATAVEDYAPGVAAIMPGGPTGLHVVDVTANIQAWSDTPTANLGWIVVPTGTDGVDVRSSEHLADPPAGPELTVSFIQTPDCSDDPDCDDGDACNGAETCASGSCIDGTPVAPPTDVENLNMPDRATMTWNSQGAGVSYDVASGSVRALIVDGGASAAQCLEDDTSISNFSDPRSDPELNEGYYYMIRSQNTCSTGTYGFASSDAERLPTSACP
jgi:hypothetical protein